LPGWVSEGLADLVAVTVVPLTREKPAREEAAINDLRKGGVLGSDFFSPQDRITGLQYGVALSLNRFMHKKNPKAYLAFLGHLKEALPQNSWVVLATLGFFDNGEVRFLRYCRANE
jgi:hypothetical protein